MCVGVFAPFWSIAMMRSSKTEPKVQGSEGASPKSSSSCFGAVSGGALSAFTFVEDSSSCFTSSFTCNEPAFAAPLSFAAMSGFSVLGSPSPATMPTSSSASLPPSRRRRFACGASLPSSSSFSTPKPLLSPDGSTTGAKPEASSFSACSSFFACTLRSLLQYWSTFLSSGSLILTRPSIRANSGFSCMLRPLAGSGSGGT
mmetsp:Transcript_133745/g.286005  ORF Transcript_133745/g.286005 Transcript_133745/m.286005 type:complete len:201 (-) Transcript_133745:1469-2071(-)